MFFVLSKLLPLLVYPLGLACLLLFLAIWVRRRSRWRDVLVVAALALLWLSGNRIVAMLLVRSLEWQYLPDPELQSYATRADAIVVLGGGTLGQGYPRLYSEVNEAGDRLLYAARLYRNGVAPRIVLSGGSARLVGEPTITDAESMADVLIDVGIPEEVLVLEGTSRNTAENARETQRILEEQGLERIVLVTSALHMPRAVSVFRKLGLDVVPAPTDFHVTQHGWEYRTRLHPLIQLDNLLPAASSLRETTHALKEYIGLVVYRLRGWR
jgi:uncharacterized SAM-binding protein YcdF (DUF218 family)